ncbi:MAG TPA: TIGR01777 family oxidoreductase [Longilinea sp.]|nr:TIGR01777 family oxidoreductase [Longilinea sp.]
MHVLIAGGTGMIGIALSKRYIELGHQVTVLTRDPARVSPGGIQYLTWNGKDPGEWGQIIEKVDGVINLAGESIGSGRWTAERKKQIQESRQHAGEVLAAAVISARHKPEFFLQASAIGAYGTAETQTFIETSPYGSDFLAQTCQKWEASTLAVEQARVRRIVTRIGVVLDKKSGALPRMLLPIHYYAGGPLGTGRQWLSWISLSDLVDAIVHLTGHGECQGIYNLTSPNPANNREFGQATARILRRPFWLPIPGFALRLLLGEMSTLVLDGQKVMPQRLIESGYSFLFPNLETALQKTLSGV